jgi:hypothetical protein
MFRSALAAVLALALSSSTAAAQGAWTQTKTLLDLGNRLAQQTTTDSNQSGFTVSYGINVTGDDRQLALLGLQSALQTFDVMTTVTALSAGHHEANPLLFGGNRTAMLLAKSAALGFHVLAVEQIRKRRPKAALWTMVAANAAMFAVVANNTAVARR